MVYYSDLNDTNALGVASSKFQGEFIGSFAVMPDASEEYANRLVMYTGTSLAYEQYAFYVCRQVGSEWTWVRVAIRSTDTLEADRALVSGSDGTVVASDVTSTELGYLDGVTSNVQTQLDGKQDLVTGGAVTVVREKLKEGYALVSNAQGNVAVSVVTAGELESLHGFTGGNLNELLKSKAEKALTINGYPLVEDIELTADDVGAISASVGVPTKTSDLVNDAGFVTRDTADLDNYYTKDETYSRAEVSTLLQGVTGMSLRFVDALPSVGENGYIYLIAKPDGEYQMYIWSGTEFVYTGTTKVVLEISQTVDHISIDGIQLQEATSSSVGLMTAEHVRRLEALEDGTDTRETTWNDVMSFADGVFTVPGTFDVEVFSAGAFGETNMLCSVIPIHRGTYTCVDGQSLVFSNAESNSRLGTRVVLSADGSVRVYDCNGTELTVREVSDYVSSDESCYRLLR